MISTCDLVAERIALGEPLDDVAEHAATCARCRRLAGLPRALGGARRDVDPGLGFSARITAGAQHRIVVRRRQRVAMSVASVVAVAAVAVVVVTREPSGGAVSIDVPQLPAAAPAQHDPWKEPHALDPDVVTLVHYAQVDRAMHVHAHWNRIERPLAPYRALVAGVSP